MRAVLRMALVPQDCHTFSVTCVGLRGDQWQQKLCLHNASARAAHQSVDGHFHDATKDFCKVHELYEDCTQPL